MRLLLEERASFSPDALTGLEANLRFAGPETMETRIFGRLTAWQNWIFQRPNAVGDDGSLKRYGTGERPTFDPHGSDRPNHGVASMPDGIAIDYDGLIPNNVGLADDLRVRKALETWHPGYIDWWKTMGPEGFQNCPRLPAHRRRRRQPTAGPNSTSSGCPNTAGASCWRPRSKAAPSRSAPTRASPPGRKSPANTAPCCAACWSSRATPSRPASSSNAISAPPRRRSTTCATCSR